MELFENDVEMYGAQTRERLITDEVQFENDVEMYGAQTESLWRIQDAGFENDVEMYGAQTVKQACLSENRLRMM